MIILVDTGPLVGLINPRDQNFARSRSDLQKLTSRTRPQFLTTIPILTEAFFLLRIPIARRKLIAWLDEMDVTVAEPSASILQGAFHWIIAYADHEPDFADAFTVALCAELEQCQVWTYDREFRTIWRRPDGSKIPMALPR